MSSCSIDVFLALNGEIIPNNGYVDISVIGPSDDTALLCITNRPGTPTSGNWFAPDRTRVDGTDVPGFIRTRGSMVVRLFRMGSRTPRQGIYYCIIEDGTSLLKMVNVGLYNSGGGNNTNDLQLFFSSVILVQESLHCLEV